MTAHQINASALTTFEVDPDGAEVRIHVRDRDGAPASLVLPAKCITQLLMSLPRMLQTALRNSHGDDSLRLVHPLEAYRLELGEPVADGTPQFILTLQTQGGFDVSFVATADSLADLARAIDSHALSYPTEHDKATRLS